MSWKFHYVCVCGSRMSIEPLYAGRLARCPLCRRFVLTPVEMEGAATGLALDLRTERLLLTPAQPGDLRALHPVHGNPQNYDYELGTTPDLRATGRMLKESRYPKGFAKTSRLTFKITLREGGAVAGLVFLSLAQDYLTAAVGFMIDKPVQGRGLGTEAVREVVRFSLEILNLQKVSAACDSENLSCRRLLERCGFTLEGELKYCYLHPERGWIHSPHYAIYHPELAAR